MIAKRVIDLALALSGLILLAPLFAAFAVWIKLDTPGPVFFRQERVGRYGRTFRIHKFRTMVAEAPRLGPQITTGRDARVTRSGRFLRRYKLDELPQLIDVAAGTMSLVGPRPEVPRYVAMYSEEDRRLILSVPPGITDISSIEFRNEDELLARAQDPEREYVEHIMPKKLEFCRTYVRTRSLRGDLGLILRTVQALVSR